MWRNYALNPRLQKLTGFDQYISRTFQGFWFKRLRDTDLIEILIKALIYLYVVNLFDVNQIKSFRLFWFYNKEF